MTPLQSLDKKPPASWPRQGKIEFIETTMSYNIFDPPVLKNLNLLIKPREKVYNSFFKNYIS